MQSFQSCRSFSTRERARKVSTATSAYRLLLWDVQTHGSIRYYGFATSSRDFPFLFFETHYPQWLVLEVGADRPNDIKNVTKWLKPDVVVLTAFAKVPVHIEFFKNREAIIREKKYLVDALKHDGVLVVNGDDDDAMKIKDQTKNISIIYGTSSSCDLIASDEQIYYENGKPTGMTFKMNMRTILCPWSSKVRLVCRIFTLRSLRLPQDSRKK